MCQEFCPHLVVATETRTLASGRYASYWNAFLLGNKSLKKIRVLMEDIGLFCGPLIPLFWTSDDVGPEFQSQRGYPHLHALLPVCNGILRFTSGVTPADLLAAISFQSMQLRTSIGGSRVHDLSCRCLTAARNVS